LAAAGRGGAAIRGLWDRGVGVGGVGGGNAVDGGRLDAFHGNRLDAVGGKRLNTGWVDGGGQGARGGRKL